MKPSEAHARVDDEILHGIATVARTHVRVHSALAPETHLLRDLELDSLARLTLVSELENHFRIAFDEGDEHELETVADLVALIGRRLYEGRTLVEALERAATSQRGSRFLDKDERETWVPYRETLARARRTAGGLQALGVDKGDRVAIILPTSPEFYDAFFGSLLAGAVPVPLYPPVRLGRMDEYHQTTARMLRTVDARLVLTSARVQRVLGRTMEAARPRLGCHVVDDVASDLWTRPTIDIDDAALIQFSSGATVDPKPVVLTHRQIMANVAAITYAILRAYPERDGLTHNGVTWLPLYHDMGLVGCVLVAVARPGDLTLIPPEVFVTRPAIWLRAIARHRGTVSPAPNFAYSLCAERIRDEEIADLDLSSWRLALNGAEPVTVGALQRFVERFAPHGLRPTALTPVYGLAEAALAVTFADPRAPFRVTSFDHAELARGRAVEATRDGNARPLVSVGKPLPGYDVVVRRDDGTVAEPGEVGRLHARGPSIMRGYHGNPEATDAVLRDGWLDTGDTAFFHDGELYIFGRAKDVIIVRGRNYSPQQFEHLVDEVPGARRGCAAAVSAHLDPDDESESLILFVEHAQDAGASADLADRVRAHVTEASGLVPGLVVVLEPGTLPRTSSGKLRRGEALRRYQAGTLAPPDRVTVWRLAAEMVRSRVAFTRAKP